MQKIAILGSTGSIGTNTLDVVSRFRDTFRVVALSTNSNTQLLKKQVDRFRPEAVGIVDLKKSAFLRRELGRGKARVYTGEEGLCDMLRDVKVDTLIVGIVGASALLPILTAIGRVKRIAIANKEAIVMAGSIIMKKLKEKNAELLPIDSEHSAIFQCLETRSEKEIKGIYLTGSGGPLFRLPKRDFKKVTPRKAVNHPKWKMGRKISVDSATLMNKGLEVIEAHHLFGVDVDRIQVLIHPQAVIHSMVEFVDGSIMAQMSDCDMRVPIQYALTYPKRFNSERDGLDLSKIENLHFYKPDFRKFPCLGLAYEAAKKADTYPACLNASNEVAVLEFLNSRINFLDIPKVVERVLGLHRGVRNPTLGDILEVDAWARRKTKELL